jgi:hypothetical protein
VCYLRRVAAKLVKVTVKLPGIEGKWEADRNQQLASWEMYIELVTRISVQPLGDSEGTFREALSSLYVLFGETRRILRTYGPGVAKPEHKKYISFGAISVDVLNVWLRPFLSKWHPLLLDHEAHKPADRSAPDHEKDWASVKDARAALRELQGKLVLYADLLAEVSGVPSLHAKPQ